MKITMFESTVGLIYETFSSTFGGILLFVGIPVSGAVSSNGRNSTLAKAQAYAATVDYLNNGTDFVRIWISWSNDRLTVGTGGVIGSNAFLVHNDITSARSVTTLAVSSFGTSTADWIIDGDQDNQGNQVQYRMA